MEEEKLNEELVEVQPQTSEEMVEKKILTAEQEEELKRLESLDVNNISDEERDAIILEYNKQNLGQTKILREKPTEEFVAQTKKDFDDKNTELMGMRFIIADKENALRVATFLKKWNEYDAYWERDLWQGTIFFDKIISDFVKKWPTEQKALEIDYGTLTYLYLSMMNVKGYGLKAAKHRQEIEEQYSKILDVVNKHIEDWKIIGTELRFLQDRWNMADCGFILEKDECKCDEGGIPCEECNCACNTDDLQETEKPTE